MKMTDLIGKTNDLNGKNIYFMITFMAIYCCQ